MPKLTKAAVYYKDGKPFTYSLYNDSTVSRPHQMTGMEMHLVSFSEAYKLFSLIRENYSVDGEPIAEV